MTTAFSEGERPDAIHRRFAMLIQGIIATGLVLELLESQWMSAAITLGILLLTSLPVLAARWARISIPPQFELHATSGVLLGIFGFLLVYVLDEDARIEVKMKPGFVAFFAFCFSIMVGAL